MLPRASPWSVLNESERKSKVTPIASVKLSCFFTEKTEPERHSRLKEGTREMCFMRAGETERERGRETEREREREREREGERHRESGHN